MTFSLYDAIVPQFRQTLGAVAGLIDKGEAFAAERGIDPAALIGARLADDMLPFSYQVKSCAGHSIGAIEGVRAGQVSPDRSPPPDSFDALRALIRDADANLAAIDPAELAGRAGDDMAFVMGERRFPFTAETYLLSFALPNFYFHASMAYAVLRAQGVPIGKADWLGQMRMKAA